MSPDATAHLTRVSSGDSAAIADLMPLVYDELRQIAAAHLAQEQAGHTLQPTALVHEAYLKLVNQSRAQWKDRAHFLAIASGVIRRILIDHARGRRAKKRGSDKPMTLGSIQDLADTARNVDLLEIGDALDRLAQLDARQAKIVELRYFGGLDVRETAEVLGVSTRTVELDWRFARVWLARELSEYHGQ
jgi:RNA polymerase sigma factor (TIGR02999 family)